MATSGSFITTGYADAGWPDHYVFNWSVLSQSIENNTTTITWTLKGAGADDSYNYTIVKKRKITVNGNTQEVTTEQKTLNGTVAFSGTAIITHNSDGTGKFSASAQGAFYYNEYNSSGSGSWDLPAIPRATKPTLSATSITMGNNVTITLSPASSSFKHKIRYTFGSLTGQTSGLSVGADFTSSGNVTVTFTPPTSLASQIPNALSGVCTVYCYTYNSSGTQIGSPTSLTLTLNVPNYTPTVNSITLTGNNTLGSAYVRGKSTVNITAKVSSSYGATIARWTTTVDGVVYTTSTVTPVTTLEGTITSEPLTSGTKTFPVTVVDSRGKTATVNSTSITVYDYSAPYITSFSLERQTDGTTVIAKLVGGISPINNQNTKIFGIVLNGVTKYLTPSGYVVDGTVTFTNVPTDNTFTATAGISDAYTTVTVDATLPTVAVTMDFYKDGTGIAMGKVAEQGGLLDVAWPIKAYGVTTRRTIRPTSANITPDKKYYGASEHYLASSAMTTGKPMTVDGQTASTHDGHILHLHWDDSTGYDSQLFIKNSNGSLLSRGCNAGVWSSWKQMLDTSLCKDYVIEQGTTDGWNYTKWKNGKIEIYGDKSLTFPAGTQISTNYLWRSIVTIDLSGILTTILTGDCPIQYNAMIPRVCRHSTYPTRAEIVIVTSRPIDGFTITVPLYIIGKWN